MGPLFSFCDSHHNFIGSCSFDYIHINLHVTSLMQKFCSNVQFLYLLLKAMQYFALSYDFAFYCREKYNFLCYLLLMAVFKHIYSREHQ